MTFTTNITSATPGTVKTYGPVVMVVKMVKKKECPTFGSPTQGYAVGERRP
jgi:hypothetical protein